MGSDRKGLPHGLGRETTRERGKGMRKQKQARYDGLLYTND